MKHSRLLHSLLSLCLTLTACVGQKEEIAEDELQLTVDKTTILADGADEARFTLLYQGYDVTAESEILHLLGNQSERVEGNRFSTTKPGSYRFIGTYRGIDTPTLQVQAIEQEEEKQEGDFFRRSLVMKFTATWCVNCPNMSDAIKTAQEARPDRIIDLAVHYIDEMEADDGKEYSEHFGISAIPVAVVNQDAQAQTSIASSTILMDYVDRTITGNLPACGIKLDTYEDGQQLKVDVEGSIVAAGKYKLAVALVQDDIRKAQTGGSTDYQYNSVLKDYLQTPALGEDLGSCQVNDIIQRTYTCPLSTLDEGGTYRIIAYLLGNDGMGNYTVNNVTQCKVRESVDYLYE